VWTDDVGCGEDGVNIVVGVENKTENWIFVEHKIWVEFEVDHGLEVGVNLVAGSKSHVEMKK